MLNWEREVKPLIMQTSRRQEGREFKRMLGVMSPSGLLLLLTWRLLLLQLMLLPQSTDTAAGVRLMSFASPVDGWRAGVAAQQRRSQQQQQQTRPLLHDGGQQQQHGKTVTTSCTSLGQGATLSCPDPTAANATSFHQKQHATKV